MNEHLARRGSKNGGGRYHSEKTHCKNGHEYSESNTRIYLQKRGGLGRACKSCVRKRCREHRNAKLHSRSSAWKRYGIVGFSIESYKDLFRQQNGKCAICHKGLFLFAGIGEESACVDHDKNTGNVRGLLCRTCNRGLGLFGDTADGVMNAVAYLEKEYGGIQSGCL